MNKTHRRESSAARVSSRRVACVLLRAATLAIVLEGSTCAQYEGARATALEGATAAEDRARDDAELVLCRGISVGAWARKYGNAPNLAQAWRVLCGSTLSEAPR